MTIKLGVDEMRCIAVFESLTGAKVQDCLIDDNGTRLTFVVKQGELGVSIGKGGANIKKVRNAIGKAIEVIEYSDDLTKFIKNTLAPARIKNISLIEKNGKKVALVEVEEEDMGLAIGRGGEKILRAKKLVVRHHGVQDILLQHPKTAF